MRGGDALSDAVDGSEGVVRKSCVLCQSLSKSGEEAGKGGCDLVV